jgi:hypothetical protein
VNKKLAVVAGQKIAMESEIGCMLEKMKELCELTGSDALSALV